jgi:hypothetical protein
VVRLYHGGTLDEPSGSLWASPDADYAAAFAQLHEGPLWMLTLDVSDDAVLDLTGCGLNVARRGQEPPVCRYSGERAG